MPSHSSSFIDFVNMPDLLDRVDNDLDFIRELLEIFKGEFPRLRIELKEAVSKHDMPLIASTAHSLRGMLNNLSLEASAAAIEKVEQMASAEDQPGVESALAEFDEEVEGMPAALDEYLSQPQA